MALSKKVFEMMRKKAEEVTSFSGDGRRIDLTGSKAVVRPGGKVTIRLLPRWDSNEDEMIFVPAKQHWFTNASGQLQPAWCAATLKKPCPFCERVKELRRSSDPELQAQADELEAREVFLVNAVVGKAGERTMDDVGYIVLTGPQFSQIISIMTGDGDEDEAFGDVSDINEGYDLIFSRPAGKGGRWDIKPAKQASPLYTMKEKALWKGFSDGLLDLEAFLRDNTRAYKDNYKALFGTEPDSDAVVSDSEDEVEEEVVQKKAVAKKKKAVIEEEPEEETPVAEEEEEEAADEEEEDEEVEDEDEEVEDEDEEEDDEELEDEDEEVEDEDEEEEEEEEEADEEDLFEELERAVGSKAAKQAPKPTKASKPAAKASPRKK
jgi:hypothetical protein